MKIVYEILNKPKKSFFDGAEKKQHAWNFQFQIIFTELTLEDRATMGFEVTETVEGEEVELKDYATKIFSSSEYVPPYATVEEAMTEVKSRIERRIQGFQDKFIKNADEEVAIVTEDPKFKEKFTTADDLKEII